MPEISRLFTLMVLGALAVCGQQYAFLPVAGSPKNVIDLFEDSHHRLWLATDEGDVLSFDGARFYSLRALGLPPIHVSDFAEDSGNGIWNASDAGLFRYFQGTIQTYFQGRNVAAIVTVAPGVMVASVMPRQVGPGHYLEIYRLRQVGPRFQAERLEGWWGWAQMAVDRDGTLLTTCPGGWCEYSRSSIVGWHPGAPNRPSFHPYTERNNQHILRDKSGCVWFRNFAEAGYQCPGGKAPQMLATSLNRINSSVEMHEAPDGDMVWVGEGLLLKGRPGMLRSALPENGLPLVRCSLPARDGVIWLGGPGGLYRFMSPFRLEYWTQREGSEAPAALARLGDRMVAGTARGLAILTPDRTRWQKVEASKRLGPISSLAVTERGTLLAVQLATEVIEMDLNGKVQARSKPFGVVKVVTNKKDAWATGVFLTKLERRGSQIILHRIELPAQGNGWNVEIEPKTQQLWQCNSSGVGTLLNGHWRFFTTANGLLENTCSAIAPQAGGDIWIGYGDTAAFAHLRFGSSVQQFMGGGEVGNARVRTFGTDARGWLWRGGTDGMHVALPQDAESGQWTNLTEDSGLPSLEANRGSFFSDSDGSVWWGTGHSVVHYSPNADLARPAGVPPIYVSGFSIGNSSPEPIEAHADLRAGGKLVVFLGCLDFAHRGAVRLRYRLEGSAPWQAVHGFQVDLQQPGWGSHTVEFQSRYLTGPWSPILRTTFVVGPPSWLTRRSVWFGSLALLVLMTAFHFRRNAQERRVRELGTLPSLDPWRILATSPEIGDLLDTTLDKRFRIDTVIDSGAFGAVLAGRDNVSGGRCAIKVFHRVWAEADWINHRFEQEVAALRKVHHPNVVSILGYGRTPEGGPYLAMEFIEGKTLREVLEGGPMPQRRVGRILLQAGKALDAIHAQGIFHRDLKPENLMLRAGAPADEELVLIDFSIAIIKDADKSMQGRSRAAGTFYYMAPEQSVGFATPASDIHSLAKIVIEMLTAERLTTLLPAATIDLPKFIPDLARTRKLPFSAASIQQLSMALEFDPAARPQQALPFSELLASDLLVEGEP